MKRPEGFDRAPQPPARRGAGASAERKRRAAPAPERHSEATAHSQTARPTTARPESTQRETERRESAPTERVAPSRAAAADRPKSRASRRRTARAEIRAAARARRREEKAEVRRFTAATRRRRTVALSALGVVAAAVGLVAFAVFSPLLALREVVVAGTERLDPDAIVSALEPEIGVRQTGPAYSGSSRNFCMSQAPVGQRSAHRPQCRQTFSSLTITRDVSNSPET